MRKSVPYAGRAMTLHQIASELGISYERVRQIEKEAISKIKAKLKARNIDADSILPSPFDEARQ